MVLNWGIISSGLISHDFVTALGTLPKSDHNVVAVGARKLSDAKKFAKLHEIPKFYEGYDSVMNDPEVDIVYIGTINTKHFEVGMKALEAGKHVLCEKPLCMNEKQAKHLLNTAKEKGLFCMEAVWTRFFPAFTYLKKRIEDGDLGEVIEVEAALGHAGWGEVDRVRLKNLGGGTILDLGVYSIQAALWVIPEEPIEINATGILNSDKVDSEMRAELKFQGNKIARVNCSGIHSFHNSLIVTGTRGKMTVHSFWAPTSLTDIDGTRKTWKLPGAKHYFNFPNSCGLRYEAEEARKCIENGLIESPSMNHDESLRIARIEDECRKMIGVEYPEDQ